MLKLEVNIDNQQLVVSDNHKVIKTYQVSTAKNGVGEIFGSEQTPRGKHIIRAKIGANSPLNSVFVKRRPTGEIYDLSLRASHPGRDWILTRILWLSGMEVGKNRLGNVDTMRRYIYIHGTPQDVDMTTPGSRGCIRMQNDDLIELFDLIPVGTPITIK